MAIFSVHLLGDAPPQVAADRAVFVRDGFAFWAFLLGPLWFLWHREWLGLVGWLVIAALIAVSERWLGSVTGGGFELILALATGIVANDIRRLTLALRGFRESGVVEAQSHEAAERRFFDSWLAQPRPASPSAPPVVHPARSVPPGVLGLFPESGARP
ncbi:DUF2628 domain-containing protein [Pleomorphomonas carboxyditropha]|uniref:DUF2628 domain-containing protein n=1 Tax=Pleomorphomonas carboxyditropha TaxID=2023338 RepID=A0A2G9WU57_9HYPH|nr:DUF2628 domain-containing protein [Pleomorphomonas carboxyditropha]PIO97832.1 hypothetical protein CJ014_18210 [Pleomorphomonas carboxyditropha]